MALRWADSFDFWTTMPGTFTIAGSGQSVGSGKLTLPIGAGPSYGEVTLDSQATWIVNIRANFNGIVADTPFLTFRDSGTAQCSLVIRSTGALAFYRGTSSAQVGSDSSPLVLDNDTTYYDIEVKVTIHNTTGQVQVKVNGASVISTAADQNTRGGSNNSANGVLFGNVTDFGSAPTVKLQHAVIMDSTGSQMNNFLGPVNVNLHDTTADGNYTTWAANTGNRYQAVDETNPNGDTDYVSAASVGDKVTFAMGNLPAGVTTVHSVFLWTDVKRDDATTRGYKALLRYSGADSNPNAEHTVGSSYAYFFDAFDVSPFSGGSTAWTTTEVDGVEAGAIITT